MKTSTCNKQHSFKANNLVTAGILAVSALTSLLPATATAALVTGEATITIDNPTVTGSIPSNYYFGNHWGESDNAVTINSDATGGTAIGPNEVASLLFPVNTNTTTTVVVPPGTGSYGRTLQATTMDANDTSTGQIGLSGAFRLSTPDDGTYLGPYDFNVKNVAGQWNIYGNDSGFGEAILFRIDNVVESVDADGALSLDGDLFWSSGFSWNLLLNGDLNTQVGSFSLSPSAVPVPAAVWLFGSGLLGLVATGRRKASLA